MNAKVNKTVSPAPAPATVKIAGKDVPLQPVKPEQHRRSLDRVLQRFAGAFENLKNR